MKRNAHRFELFRKMYTFSHLERKEIIFIATQ